MHKKTRPLIYITLLSLLLGSISFADDFVSANPEQLGMSSERLARLDEALKSYVDEDRLAGQVVLVLRNGRIAYSTANGWRNKEAGLPMENDTIFRIASQTKAIVSAGIMILQERGALDISDPLSRFIPAWADAKVAVAKDSGGYDLVPVRRPILLRDLLTHTSGLDYGTGGVAEEEWRKANQQGWYFANRDESMTEIISRMAALPLRAHPGEQWIYGYSTDVLGAVIEVVSGQSLATFLQQEIFDPLDMQDTHFFLPKSKVDRLATVYRPREGGGIEARPETDGMQSQGMYVDGPGVSFSGGAGLLSTASDYAKFLQMTLNGGELNGARILSPKTIELMTSSHLRDIPYQNGQGFGLGFSVVEDLGDRGTLGTEGEYGWGGAYHSSYWVDPVENLVVVYLTQIIPATGLDDFNRLRNGIYQSIIE